MSETGEMKFTTSAAWPDKGGTPVIAAIAEAFRNDRADQWRDDPVLTLSARHPSADIVKVSLVMAWLDGADWQINRGCERSASYDPTMTSVGNRARLGEFAAHPVEDAVCVGACVPNQVAAQVVEDFGANPTVLSGACDWVPWSELAFPRED